MPPREKRVPTKGQPDKKILNLLDAISLIQQAAAAESGAGKANIDAEMFTPAMQGEFGLVGALWAIISTVLTAIVTPLAIMVLDGDMTAFGGHGNHPVFDRMFVAILALSSSVGISLAVAGLARFYVGNYARKAITALLWGLVIAAAVMLLISLFLYGLLYVNLDPGQTAEWLIVHSSRWFSDARLRKVYHLLMSFRGALPKAALFMLVAKGTFVAFPLINLQRHKRRLIAESLNEDEEF